MITGFFFLVTKPPVSGNRTVTIRLPNQSGYNMRLLSGYQPYSGDEMQLPAGYQYQRGGYFQDYFPVTMHGSSYIGCFSICKIRIFYIKNARLPERHPGTFTTQTIYSEL